MLLLVALLGRCGALSVMPSHVFKTIAEGRVAVVDDFLTNAQVCALREDASQLFAAGLYNAPSRDVGLDSGRAVLREASWSDYARGDGSARSQFASVLASLRGDLAAGLARPDLAQERGPHRHEVSYTRFGYS